MVLLLCVLVGGVIGYFVYEGQLWENAGRRSHEQVVALEEENKTLSGAEQQAGGAGDGTGGRDPDTERHRKPEGAE